MELKIKTNETVKEKQSLKDNVFVSEKQFSSWAIGLCIQSSLYLILSLSLSLPLLSPSICTALGSSICSTLSGGGGWLSCLAGSSGLAGSADGAAALGGTLWSLTLAWSSSGFLSCLCAQ